MSFVSLLVPGLRAQKLCRRPPRLLKTLDFLAIRRVTRALRSSPRQFEVVSYAAVRRPPAVPMLRAPTGLPPPRALSGDAVLEERDQRVEPVCPVRLRVVGCGPLSLASVFHFLGTLPVVGRHFRTRLLLTS